MAIIDRRLQFSTSTVLSGLAIWGGVAVWGWFGWLGRFGWLGWVVWLIGLTGLVVANSKKSPLQKQTKT